MTTQLVLASTAVGLATVVAAKRAGLLRPADRHLLLRTGSTAVPEAADFDAVLDLDDAVAALSSSGWAPRESELPVWQRSLRSRWDLTDGVDLLVEDLQAGPALALCRVFADARIDVCAEGLTAYGPTPVALPDAVGARVERLLHLDLVPGLAPLLLRELGVATQRVPTEAFTTVVGPPAAGAAEATEPPVALLLGQDLAALGLLSAAEEAELYAGMLRGTVAAGHRRLELQPHPGAPVGPATALRALAAELGVQLEVRAGDEPAEARFARGGIAVVVGCASTALATARFYGLRTATTGTDLLLERLAPDDSHRVAAAVVRATVRDLDALAGCADHRPPPEIEVDLAELVETVAYCLQPQRNPDLRATAVRVLRAHPYELRRYVDRRRLSILDLPGGGVHRRLVPPVVRRAAARLNRRR